MKYTIYGIKSPECKDIVYVGQTMNMDYRRASHTRYATNPDVKSFMESLSSKNIEPEFVLIEELSGLDDVNARERFWIDHYNSVSPLLNSTQGRPKKTKDEGAKQMNVMVPSSVKNCDKFKEKTRFMSFSQYVNSLIAKDLEL